MAKTAKSHPKGERAQPLLADKKKIKNLATLLPQLPQ
jgi:hypothetical protein